MAKKIVTLHVDDTSIRLLEAHGKRLRKWADMPLEPGLVKGGVVINEAEVASKIRQLLKDQKVKAKKVIIGLSGIHCLSRPLTFPQLPKEMLDEAVMREAKRVLPVPLEQLHISWQTIPVPGEKAQVYLLAVPRKSADAMVKTLHRAGLKPYLMDIKPLALARVAKEATAIIVNIEPTELDIVIMADGIPQPIRTVSFPSKALSWQERLSMIRDEIDRTIKFYNSNYADKSLDQSTPMFVSGELAENSKLASSLSEGLGYPVLPLSPSLECPESFPANRYMVNIGLVLKELRLGREAEALVVNPNALPLVYQPKPISWVRVIALPIIITVAAGLIPLWMLIQSGSANIASVQDQLDRTNQLFTEKQSQRLELKDNVVELQAALAEAEASRDNLTAALSSLDRQGSEVYHNLEEVVSALPDTIILKNINHTEGTLTVTGTSPSETEVLQYAQSLDGSGRFAGVFIASMVKKVETIEVEIIEDEVIEDEIIEDVVIEVETIEVESTDFTLALEIRG
jgi:type IV pilus assembly protein PilM